MLRRRNTSILGEARSDPLQSARSDSLQEEGGVADFSEAESGAMKARKDSRSMSGDFFKSPLCHVQRTTVRTERVIIPNSVKIT